MHMDTLAYLTLTPVPLNEFLRTPQQTLLTYPQASLTANRIAELQALGVTAIYDWGPKQIQRWRCLGLGYCGLVLLVEYQGQYAALKVRRSDAPRKSFAHEAAMLTLANAHHIGPQLLNVSANYLLMDYVAGQPLCNWLQLNTTLDISRVQNMLSQILQQAFRLDQVGLDHGNLRCVTAHTMVTPTQAVILDFSSASTSRRPANVTSLTPGLCWGTTIASLLVPHWISPDQEQCIDCLRQYKHDPSQHKFDQLLSILFNAA